MKVLFMTGSHPRHAYISRCIEESGALSGLIIEKRENHIPAPPEDLSPELTDLFIHHFRKRKQAETKFFNNPELPKRETLFVTKESLNDIDFNLHHLLHG